MATPSFQSLNQITRHSSHWIVGQHGSGKTHLLRYMLAADLHRDCSIVIMDSKGELTDAIRHLALGDRLIVFDPDEPFAINPFDTPNSQDVVSHLGYMLGGLLETNITPKQRTFFDSLVYALLSFPNPSIMLIWDILSKGPKAYTNIINTLPEDIQSFFFSEWHDYTDTAGEMRWRLRGMMNKHVFKTMFRTDKTRFHIGAAMDAGKVIVIDNSQAKCTMEGCGFLGRFFVSQIWSAGTARALIPDHKKKPTFVYIDEAHLVIKKDQKIAAIIDELRSQKIGLVLAHQKVRGQIDDLNVLSSLENCAIKMANVDADAPYFSKLLNIPEERMRDLPKGHFVMHVRGEGSCIIQVPPKVVMPCREMSTHEEVSFRTRMKLDYGARLEAQPPLPQAPKPPPPPTARPSGPHLRTTTTNLLKHNKSSDDSSEPSDSWS
jgi:type IV secretory pathway VirB4 component